MSHPEHAWASGHHQGQGRGFDYSYPSMAQMFGVGTGMGDPTQVVSDEEWQSRTQTQTQTRRQQQQQPFTNKRNVSNHHQQQQQQHQHQHYHTPDHAVAMAAYHQQQHPPIAAALGVLSAVAATARANPQNTSNAPNTANVPNTAGAATAAAGAAAEACCVSPPCDKADCDEATICYEHPFPHAVDYHYADALSCNDGLDCGDTNCNIDWLCTDINCHEANCHEPHTQPCPPTCPAVTCSDPTCNEDHLYCCLSDICPHPHPHRPGQECAQPCHDSCMNPPPLCHVASTDHAVSNHHPSVSNHHPSVSNHHPFHSNHHPSVSHHHPSHIAVSQDAMSCSTISTPTNDSISTPDTFQSLIDAAQILPPLPLQQTAPPPRKRMRLEDSTSLYHDFSAPYYTPQDYWSFDAQQSFPSANLPPNPPSQPQTARNTPTAKTKPKPPSRKDKASSEHDEIPVCRWHDENTGPCDRVFATIEDLHNHVKEHTGQLIPSKTPSRNFICRWANCEKDAPFGTKNHLDRHMQNHTRFKPFACNICGHRCVTHQQLSNHLTTHSRQKNFACDFPGCTKVFGVKTALSTHKRTHTNEKPFSCKWCGDSYSDSSNLSKHRKTVHEDDRTSIECPDPTCEYRDSRAMRLERHCRETGHGAEVLGDAGRWSEWTRKRLVRSRTVSISAS